MDEAADLVVSYGGSLSGEHGDGQARGEFLPKMFGETLYQAFREFKSIWDPQWKMNPGKMIDAYPSTSNLRLGPDYNPPQPDTHFQFPDDQHSFARAALRCVGVGDCRQRGRQVMCPSYMVTREEKHSTRGRARLLCEMMNGEVLTDGWKSEAVKDALDLCLACKGCKGDCPVNVDMATYKAEFLSHYYEGRLRPRHAYAMGWIYWWARLASLAPDVANFFSQTPGLQRHRQVARRHRPAAAACRRSRRQTFKDWFRRRPAAQPGPAAGDPVAGHVQQPLPSRDRQGRRRGAGGGRLPGAGCREASLCCGRPLYDFGMLDTAKALLRQILDTLRPQIEAGIPVVGLEPSCVAVFRDELIEPVPQRRGRQAAAASRRSC